MLEVDFAIADPPTSSDPGDETGSSRSRCDSGGRAPAGTALDLDRRACLLAAARTRLSLPLARTARAFHAQRGWSRLGYARLQDYARERLGRSARWLRDLAGLGETVESHPPLAAALTGDDGGRPLGRVAARMIGRVAAPESAGGWIAYARSVSVRRLAEAVADARAVGSVRPPGSASEATVAAAKVPGEETPADTKPAVPASEATAGGEEGEAGTGDALEDRRLVSLHLPTAVKAAFEEAFELHKAVSGEESTVTAFVESLVGESFAGPCPPDVDLTCLRRGPARRAVEEAMARATRCWERLGSFEPAAAAGAPGFCLSRLVSLSAEAGSGDAAALDAQLREAIAIEDELERSLGAVLATMADRGAWATLQFAGSGHYACERLGMARTTAEDRLRLDRLARRFPQLRRAYLDGRVGLQAALLVGRLLNRGSVESDAVGAWVERAEEATVKRLRDEVRAVALRGIGLGPDPEASGPAWSEFADPPADSGSHRTGPLSDEAWRHSIRRAPGDARRRIAALGQAAALGPAIAPGRRHGAGPGLADSFLRLRLPEDLAAGFLAAIESSRRGLTALAESVPWHEPWPDPNPAAAVIAARTFSTRCRRVPSWVGLLGMLEDYAATWDDPEGMPERGSDEVYVRDGWRCTAPGCSSRRNLEDHHVQYRSQGGGEDLSNRICLCRFHHQQGEHGGLASCSGRAPLEVSWSLGKDGTGGRFLNERWIDRPGRSRGAEVARALTAPVGICG